jgi:ADP-ribose pyrophosphatase YjhB (NUDIX family)
MDGGMSNSQSCPRLGASACVWRGDRVLIVQRGKPPVVGVWSLPGGAVEPGETVKAAAARELMEETGVAAELTQLVEIADVIRRDAQGTVEFHYAIACFAGAWMSGEPKAQSDALAARWASLAELGDLTMTEGTLAVIAKARAMLSD